MTRRKTSWARRPSAALLAVGTCAAITAGCDGANDSAAPSVENVVEDTQRFVGQRHTLLGEVDEVYSDKAFMLEERGAILDEEVLVLTRQPIQLTGTKLADDLDVFVTGTVHEMLVPQIEEHIGWDLDTKLAVAFKNRPVVIADRIEAMETFAAWSEKDIPEGELVSLWAFYAPPLAEQLAGRPINLASVKVTEPGDRTLWIGVHDHADMLVAPMPGLTIPSIEEGTPVHVKGTIKRLPEPDALPDTWQLSREDKQALREGQLYIEARVVHPQVAAVHADEAALTDQPG